MSSMENIIAFNNLQNNIQSQVAIGGGFKRQMPNDQLSHEQINPMSASQSGSSIFRQANKQRYAKVHDHIEAAKKYESFKQLSGGVASSAGEEFKVDKSKELEMDHNFDSLKYKIGKGTKDMVNKIFKAAHDDNA